MLHSGLTPTLPQFTYLELLSSVRAVLANPSLAHAGNSRGFSQLASITSTHAFDLERPFNI